MASQIEDESAGGLNSPEPELLDDSERTKLNKYLLPEAESEQSETKNTAAEKEGEEKKKPERTRAQKQASFKFIMRYAYRECGWIILGLLFLLGSSLTDLTVPLFMGRVIDSMTSENFDDISGIIVYMIIVVLVSSQL